MSQSSEASSSNFGQRLMVNVVDSIAKTDPSRPFVFVPKSTTPTDGWKPITFGQISQAINSVAWEITKNHGSVSTEKFPTLAYIGPNDVRYIVILLACIKAGFQALFVSPRNNNLAQESLLDATNCSIVWHADTFADTVKSWDLRRRVHVVEIPSLEAWLEPTQDYPYNKSFNEARWEPAMVLHTSGSTGVPKPIVIKQGSLANVDGMRQLTDLQGAEFWFKAWSERSKRFFTPMPLFHAAGLGLTLSLAIYYQVPVALGIAERPVNADLVIDCLRCSAADAALLPPAILEELSTTSDGIEALSKLSFVSFAGGNLGSHAGDLLADNGVLLCNIISSTEYIPYPLHFQTDPKLWQYFVINSEAMGSKWVSHENGTYELVIQRQNRDPGFQSIFYTFPELDEWSTKDLYVPHPTLRDHWAYRGRADNIIVFSTGEKLNPVSIEDMVMSHEKIQGAVVVGQDKFQPAIILEPTEPCDDEAAEALIESVWPVIEKANAASVAHGHIVRGLVMVAKPNKPFLRAAKGTILRKATVNLYADEVEDLYQKHGSQGSTEVVELDLANEEALTQGIVNLFAGTIGLSKLGAEMDFFSAGLDSLQVSSAVNLLRASLEALGHKVSSDLVSPRVVYRNPTAKQLANYLLSAINQGDGKPVETDDERQIRVMKDLLSKYTKNLPAANPNKKQAPNEELTVVISGTTGSLGAYMLDRLCRLATVKKVVALNRGRDGGKSRQPSISAARGLGTNFEKVEFLGSDVTLPDLGLGFLKYKELLGTADRIIHNAWPVNFNISVASFEPSIRGVRNLVNFSAAAAKPVPIVFISSVSTVKDWEDGQKVPETLLEDLELPYMGYGRSKLLGSLVLDAAAKESGLPTATVRVGQVAGPKGEKGAWNRQEWLPTIVASSLYLGVLPQSLGPYNVVDWVPVEDVAGIILDAAGITAQAPASEVSGYFHAVNPNVTEWPELAAAVKEHYGDRIKEIVSLEEWVARLEESAKHTADLEKNPGIKLMDTYSSMLAAEKANISHVFFDMERTYAHSPTVKRLGQITPSLMAHWCKQWEF